jgi:hypothetical protein
MKKRCVLSDGSRLRRDAAYALQKSQRVGHPEGLPERLKEAGADRSGWNISWTKTNGKNKKGRCEKIRGALFFNLIEVLLTLFCGALLCWLLLHKHLRKFSMAGKNRSARYSCLTNRSRALAAKNKILLNAEEATEATRGDERKRRRKRLVEERKLSGSAHPLQKSHRVGHPVYCGD